MKTRVEIRRHNSAAWDRLVEVGDKWSVPVSSAVIARARRGMFSVLLTPKKPVPASWFPKLRGARVLGLASAGGQQCPIFAAAGARVTSFDASPKQLEMDRLVAEREGLALETIEGDMRDLSRFRSNTFDLVFHPCSNCFVPEIRPVWREAFRVLKRGGVLLSGFCNPIVFAVDPNAEKRGVFQIRGRIPHSDLRDLPPHERARKLRKREPLEFGHTLEDQLGGQIDAGFVLTSLFEDGDGTPLAKRMPLFMATRAVKR